MLTRSSATPTVVLYTSRYSQGLQVPRPGFTADPGRSALEGVWGVPPLAPLHCRGPGTLQRCLVCPTHCHHSPQSLREASSWPSETMACPWLGRAWRSTSSGSHVEPPSLGGQGHQQQAEGALGSPDLSCQPGGREM